jgi:tRNA (adenine37-N6)-methyltransferase
VACDFSSDVSPFDDETIGGIKMEFNPIATIETCYPEKFGTPRQPGLVPESWGIIRLHNELNLADGLAGLEGFTHLWVIFVFHQNTNKGIKTKVHPPRMAGEKVGVFATRSPHRPNPIGLSVVKIERIEGSMIYVSGVDFVNGTPVLDIKPYLPSADRISEAQGGWADAKSERSVQVEFSEEALAQIDEKQKLRADSDLKSLIQSNLELDPRPVFYKGTPEQENPYMDTYGFALEDMNIVYKMEGTRALVLRLESYADWKERGRSR